MIYETNHILRKQVREQPPHAVRHIRLHSVEEPLSVRCRWRALPQATRQASPICRIIRCRLHCGDMQLCGDWQGSCRKG